MISMKQSQKQMMLNVINNSREGKVAKALESNEYRQALKKLREPSYQ